MCVFVAHSRGAIVSSIFEEDILNAEEESKEARDDFVEQRLEKEKDFFKTTTIHLSIYSPFSMKHGLDIKKMKLKTMEDMATKVRVSSGNKKTAEYRQQGNIALQLLVLSQNPHIDVDLEELLKYPLTPVPSSIGTIQGGLAKNEKSKGFKYIIEGTDVAAELPPRDKSTLFIEDGNAIFHI